MPALVASCQNSGRCLGRKGCGTSGVEDSLGNTASPSCNDTADVMQ
eukprot:COSAG01_NODE_14213_length_1482_cov_2.300072_3_plen_46_part_00